MSGSGGESVERDVSADEQGAQVLHARFGALGYPDSGEVDDTSECAPSVASGELVAPLTGTFYRSLKPEKAPFVRVGDIVNKDTIVGMIDTMGIFNEVFADRAGRIREILPESGQTVCAGDVVMIIEDVTGQTLSADGDS